MVYSRDCTLIFLATILLLIQAVSCNSRIKSETFLLPMFALEPGSVLNKKYYNIEFPRGHIGLKSFNGEIVDKAGNPVPLYEAYLHHWNVWRYFQPQDTDHAINQQTKPKGYVVAGNSGTCQGNVLRVYFALGSETRGMDPRIPDSYGIEVGNPHEAPAGFEDRWMLNLHVIDTRGVEDTLKCIECKCDQFNITLDEFGLPLTSDYSGGSRCCYHQTRCKLKEGFEGGRRNLYLRYTVKWVDWDSSILPVKVFMLDSTDTGRRSAETWIDGERISPENGCQVEYEVKACSDPGVAGNGCIDIRRASITMPSGGYIVYAVAHQHTGGIGSTLYKQDGREICTSMPIYGKGEESGNESGFLVGMTICYPRPGSVKVMEGEKLTLESNYNSSKQHTGVMGLFYILVADQMPNHLAYKHRNMFAYMLMTLFGPAILLVSIGLKYWRKRKEIKDGYQPMIRP